MSTDTIAFADILPDDPITFPVQVLADLAVTQSAGRVHIGHRDQPDEPLLSLDPADAATLAQQICGAFASVWVRDHAESLEAST